MLQCGLISFQLPLFQSVNELISYTLRIFHFSISIGRYEYEHNAPEKNESNVKQLSDSVWKVLEDCNLKEETLFSYHDLCLLPLFAAGDARLSIRL